MVKTAGNVERSLVLPIRTPRAGTTSGGALGRLWAEFTDPGPSGDASVFFRRYAPGIGPAVFGIPFLAVGILVMTLFFRRIGADPKSFVPIAFGAIFALAGLFVSGMGIKTVLSMSAGTAPRTGAPWTSDNDWDATGATPDDPTRGFAASAGRLFYLLFIGALNYLWTVPLPSGGRIVVSIVLGIFDLIALSILFDVLRNFVQAIRVGTPRLAWRTFPVFTGGRFEGVFQTTRAMRPTGPPHVTLRRIEQRLIPSSGSGTAGGRSFEVWSSERTLPEFANATMTSFPVAFDVPADQPGTDLSVPDCTYWQVVVAVPVSGPDVQAVFLVPIYDPPK